MKFEFAVNENHLEAFLNGKDTPVLNRNPDSSNVIVIADREEVKFISSTEGLHVRAKI